MSKTELFGDVVNEAGLQDEEVEVDLSSFFLMSWHTCARCLNLATLEFQTRGVQFNFLQGCGTSPSLMMFYWPNWIFRSQGTEKRKLTILLDLPLAQGST